MPEDNPRSLCRGARNFLFGLQKELPSNPTGPAPSRTQLVNVGREQAASASDPTLLAVSIGLTVDDPAANGVLDVSAEVIWTTGKTSNRAEVDVPAQGTAFTVVGGDGLEIYAMRNTGAGAKQGRVVGHATVGFASSMGGGGAQRTLVRTLPMVRALIPRFARQLVIYPDLAGAITAPPVTRVVRFFSDALTAGSLAEAEVPGGGGVVPLRIPGTALFWDVVGAPGAIVHAIFRLSI